MPSKLEPIVLVISVEGGKVAQINSGIRSVLAIPSIYRFAMRLLGNERNRIWFIQHVLGVRPGQKLVDIGCGPANILAHLPGVQYIGCDISDSYIEAARETYGDRGTFLTGSVDDWIKDPRVHAADLVLANGVLHHVDDLEVERIMTFARTILKPGGRFVFYEPCYLVWQSRLSAYLMSKDRGQNIRSENEWKNLAHRFFGRYETNVVTGVNRLSYVCIIVDCFK